MDSYLDLLTNSSASSTPQTPSPRTSVSLDDFSPDSHKPPPVEFDRKSSSFFTADNNNSYESGFWPLTAAAACTVPPPRSSFLSDLYDSHMKLDEHRTPDLYLSPPTFRPDWDLGGSVGASSAESSPSIHHLSTPIEPAFYRRASYPYVRHDHDDGLPPAPAFVHHNPNSLIFSSSRSDGIYGEPLPIQDGSLPLSADPSALHGRPMHDEPYVSPLSSLHELDSDNIKIESSSPAIVPSQAYYRPPSSSSNMSNVSGPYMPQHASIPVMHTDDAASKETQYLRRRCFNCHTTEPPSWRRSTLNPGKIVCNKCGLYERTHLRPRPHRFDELRASNKARKAAKSNPSPTNERPSNGLIKKESADQEYDHRRGSVSSSGPSGSNGHDWEDSVPRMSHSPPSHHAGPIRLPSLSTTALTDIRLSGKAPEKSSSTPYYSMENSHRSSDYFNRRPSLPVELEGVRRSDHELPEVTGWQPVPLSDLSPSPKSARKAPPPKSKVAAS